jgi:PAS domain S-box-containing protein
MSNETDTIRQHLLEHPQGLTQSDLSRELKINRVSLAKYLATMIAYGEIEYRSVGKAKLYTLTKRLPLESILWHTEDHVIITDNKGKVTQIDERSAAFFGCSVEQMIGNTIGEKSGNQFFSIDGSPLPIRQITESGSLEFIMYTGDHITYFNKKTLPVVLMDGSSGNATILTDITERKRAEKELWESEQKISSILNDITDVVWSFSWPDMNVHYISPAAEQIYGRPVQEFIEKPSLWTGIVHPDDKQIIDNAMEKLKKDGSAVKECRIVRPDESIVWIHEKSKLIFDENDTPVRVDGITSDITERKRAEIALRQVNKQLNLLSSITRHDILNQLLALKGYINLSRVAINNPEKLLEFINKEQQAANTIEEHITFTRDYKDLGATAPSWQNVNDCIRKAMLALPLRAVHVDLDPADPEVYADSLFQKVFFNLIDNALRYGGVGLKTIQVLSKESDRGLTIICEDNGMGIKDENKKRLFSRGFGKNSGLGLFLSREILSITDITITETGIPGKCARFEIAVPKGAYRFTANEKK